MRAFVADVKGDSPQIMPAAQASNVGLYDASADRGSLDMKQRLREDTNLVMGVLPEYYALALMSVQQDYHRFQAEHELIRGVRLIAQSRKPLFWTTFAVQLVLDMRHILGRRVIQGISDLQQGARAMTAGIKNLLRYHREVGVEKFSASTDQCLRQVLDLMARWTESDEVCVLLDRQNRMETPGDAAHITPYYLLERDPLWCGLLLYNFKMVAHEGAVITINSWAHVMAAAHLYNCLRQAYMLNSTWADMEIMLHMHGKERLFLGDLPVGMVDCMKRMSLAAGVPITTFANNTRKASSKTPIGNPRKLDRLAPVLWLFKGRICDSDGRVDLEPGEVAKAIDRQSATSTAAGTQRTHSDDAGTVLWQLMQVVQRESKELNFDHFGFHVRCSKLLRQIHSTVGDDLKEWNAAYRDDRNLCGIVLCLLVDAAETERLQTALGLGARLPPTHVLSRASVILGELINQIGGDAMLQALTSLRV